MGLFLAEHVVLATYVLFSLRVDAITGYLGRNAWRNPLVFIVILVLLVLGVLWLLALAIASVVLYRIPVFILSVISRPVFPPSDFTTFRQDRVRDWITAKRYWSL